MRRCKSVGLSVLALLASVSLAAAQAINPAPSNQNQPGQTSQAPNQANTDQGQVALSDQQKQAIWQRLSRARSEKAPTNFAASVGSDVPRTVRLHSFARSVVSKVPQMRRYDYAKLQNEVVIVDPKTRKVVDMVSGS